MRLDGSTLPDGARLAADVVVVGAGAAGITMALELGRQGLDVLLLESGGERPDEAAQALGDAARLDPHHVSMRLATRRQIGGATNMWGGRCVPYDPIDFEHRPYIEDARWPVAYEEVAPLFQRACDWLVCGRAQFNAGEARELAGNALVPGLPDGEVRTTDLERWSLPTNFGRVYRRDLEHASNVRLVTGLTCVEIVCPPGEDRVDHLRTRALDGRTVLVQGSRYVLAAGALEVTRLLLASRPAHHPNGIGNDSDHVGRWYMAHVEVRIAQAHLEPRGGDVLYSHERDSDGVYVRRRFTFSEELQRAERLPNAVFWFVNPEIADAGHGSGILSFVYLMLTSPFGRYFVAEGIRQAHIKSSGAVSWRAHWRNLVRDAGPATVFALRFAYERYLRPGRKVPGFFVRSASNTYPILYHGEHIPLYDSRVQLSDEVDALGLPRLRTDLRFADREVTDLIRAHEILDGYLRRHDAGHLEYVSDDVEATIREQLFGGYHQAGTTRMSERPEDGVVDRNLAVHGFDDLFVASSSTFPSSSQANTTFMIVAFALRLADRLVDIHGRR